MSQSSGERMKQDIKDILAGTYKSFIGKWLSVAAYCGQCPQLEPAAWFDKTIWPASIKRQAMKLVRHESHSFVSQIMAEVGTSEEQDRARMITLLKTAQSIPQIVMSLVNSLATGAQFERDAVCFDLAQKPLFDAFMAWKK